MPSGKYSILTREDKEQYLRAAGVSAFTAIALHFPSSCIAVLAHLPPDGGLTEILKSIKSDLLQKIKEPHCYFIKAANDADNAYSGVNKTVINKYFPEAVESYNIKRDKSLNANDCVEVMINKITGVIEVSRWPGNIVYGGKSTSAAQVLANTILNIINKERIS